MPDAPAQAHTDRAIPPVRVTPTAGSKKLLYLESIRGLAAMVVVVNHLVCAFWPFMFEAGSARLAQEPALLRFWANSPLAFVYKGNFAVDVFFVLSGFVLSYTFFRTESFNSLTAPALRRYFRLAVPSLISVLAACALMKADLYWNIRAAHITPSVWLASWYADFTPSFFAFSQHGAVYQALYGLFVGESTGYNNVLWTMRVELIGSFLVYGVLAIFGAIKHRWVIYAVITGILATTLQTHYIEFVIGMAICDAYASHDRSSKLPEIGGAGWIVLAIGLALGGYQETLLPIIHRVLPGATYHRAAGAALVLLAPLLSTAVRRPLSWKPLAFLGRISFGLYLIHVPIICSLGSWIFVVLVRTKGWAISPAAWTASLVSVIVSIVAGWVMYHVADRPSIAIGKIVSNWFTGARAKITF